MECTKCGKDKPPEDFNIRKERGQPYRQCRACMAAKSKRWFEANKEKNAEYTRNLVSARPEWAREVWREMKRRQRRDPRRRFAMAVRTAVNNSLKERRKSSSTYAALGYTKEELARHLERQFVRGMTWENYGDWHVDHIVPLSSFDIDGTNCKDFRAAWALGNLRPLWATENILKRDKRTHLL